ncbi:hypothetical protein SEUCBS139899_009048 [Sporothrix eucalyptigena]
MSGIVGSELGRHAANLADVAANPANQYGLGHGYAILPDPNDPYGWQAYEQERSRRKILEAAARRDAKAKAAAIPGLLSTTSTTAATRPSSCVSLSSLSVCSSSCETSDSEDDNDDDCKKKRKKKEKCSGSECRRKTLSIHRPGPHWCDGKKWGGKIWGLTRTPGDRKRSNWHIYFDPKVSKTEIDAICRRRYRRHHHYPHHRHHHRVKTKIMTVCATCQGLGCMNCTPGGVFVPVNYDYTGGITGYDTNRNVYRGYTPGYGGYGHCGGGGLPNMPPHPGYSGHPAGNMEHWRVHDDKGKNMTKDGSKKGSKDGSKKGSKKGSKDGSTGGGNTLGELAGRMQAMKCKDKDYWGGKWEKATDDIPKVTVGDYRLLEKGYQPTPKDEKGPGDDAAKWLWGTFGADGGGGSGGGEGRMPFYGERETPVGGEFFGNYGGREKRNEGSNIDGTSCGGGGGGGGGGSDGDAGSGRSQDDTSKSIVDGGGSGDGGSGGKDGDAIPEGSGKGGGSTKTKSVSGSARQNLSATVEDADNGGEGPSNGSKLASPSPSSKCKGKESENEGTATASAPPASYHLPNQSSQGQPSLSKHSSRQSHYSASHHSASRHEGVAATDGTDENERQSRFERLRQRLDDAGRLRTGSWERVSPEVQREREWQRQQAMKEEWQKMQAEAQGGSCGSHRGSDGGRSLLLLHEEDERAIRDQLLSDTTSGGSEKENDAVTRFDGCPYPENLGQHLDSLARRRAVSDTVSYASLDTTTTSAGTRARAGGVVSAHITHRAHSTSGDTGYETGHEAAPAIVYSNL